MKEIVKLIKSNELAIAALTSDIQEMKCDRDVMYSLMRDLTRDRSRIYEVMKGQDDCQRQLDNQQRQLVDIIESLK